MNNSHLTALRRRKLSRPMEWLFKKGLLWNPMLDYGCGHGFDADHMGAVGYDPHWRPEKPRGHFRVVTCIYVLNTIPSRAQRNRVLREVRRLTKHCGTAYVAIRADHRYLCGWTELGTWQGYVGPLPRTWHLLERTSDWELWAWSKPPRR